MGPIAEWQQDGRAMLERLRLKTYCISTLGWYGIGCYCLDTSSGTQLPFPYCMEEECCKMFGGLDILSIDAVVDKKGNHTILGAHPCEGGKRYHPLT